MDGMCSLIIDTSSLFAVSGLLTMAVLTLAVPIHVAFRTDSGYHVPAQAQRATCTRSRSAGCHRARVSTTSSGGRCANTCSSCTTRCYTCCYTALQGYHKVLHMLHMLTYCIVHDLAMRVPHKKGHATHYSLGAAAPPRVSGVGAEGTAAHRTRLAATSLRRG